MTTNTADQNRPVVAITGAGFGGLYATKQLAKSAADVDVLLIDRQNFHLFTPLLYQVATSGLEPGEIAYPVRGILRGMSNVRFLLGSVEAIDPASKTITVLSKQKTHHESYDYLIVAAGSRTFYYGMDQIAQHAFGLKSLADAVVLRNHLIKCFENAAWLDDPDEQRALTTMVVVGGGPTGLETVGALSELYRYVLASEYANQIPGDTGRVMLVEMQDHLLDPYPPRLQDAARQQLEDLGVEVILGTGVVEAGHDYIRLSDERIIRTHTLVWAAGVKASPVAEMLNVPLRGMGQVPVLPTLQIFDHPDVYVVGDMAYLEDDQGQPYPMLIPVAKQQSILAAKNIVRRLKNEPQRSFTYKGLSDRGIMATIGRSRAVAWIFYRIQLTGFIAWLAWLGLHLIMLMGFRNRLNVFINWVWNYLTYDRSVRIILEHQPHGTFAHENSEAVDDLADEVDWLEPDALEPADRVLETVID
jgi:NADH dehydrogenase